MIWETKEFKICFVLREASGPGDVPRWLSIFVKQNAASMVTLAAKK